MITDAMRGVEGIHVVPEDGAPLEEDLELARQLHDVFRWLVPMPVWRQLRSLRRVIVIPDAELHALPFEALVVQPPGEDEVQYWLDAGPTVAYGHSLGVLCELARRPATAGPATVLSVSNPDFQGALPALPGSVLESDAVVAAFGADRVQHLQGPDATEKVVRQHIGRARYVHLATHGLVDRGGDGRLSALALTASPDDVDLADDGLLQLFEIYDLRLDCDLAVLSACETQTGRRLEGEGMFALSRGFHVAGARQTIASLWSVNDDATAALMSELFEGIATDEREGHRPDVAELLRTAKRTIRADAQWSHPAYWAPFVLSGWEPSSTKENSP
jgi:CHAT domain-containing protein